MARSFEVKVLAHDRQLWSGRSVSLVVPGARGYFGILYDHAPLIARLGPGILTSRNEAGSVDTVRVKEGGFIEVRNNQITVLTDQVS